MIYIKYIRYVICHTITLVYNVHCTLQYLRIKCDYES